MSNEDWREFQFPKFPSRVRGALRDEGLMRERIVLIGGEITDQYRQLYKEALERLARELPDVLAADAG